MMDFLKNLTLKALKYVHIKQENKGVFFNFKPSEMTLLALSGSFEYMCYGSAAILNVYSFNAWIDFRRQNLTSTNSDI